MRDHSHRVVAIDVLRAIAVLLVVCSHLPFSWAQAGSVEKISALPAWSAPLINLGAYGVHLFLVLSGFCIHRSWTSASARNPSFGVFWRRRLHRLYPPYLVALVLSILGCYAVTRTWTPVLDVLALLLLVQNVTGSAARTGNNVFWSLALEEQLYALYFPLLAIRRRWGWTWTLSAIIAVVALWRAAGVAFSLPGWWTLVGPARWLEWALGAVAVEVHYGVIRIPDLFKRLSTATIALTVSVLATVYSRQYAVLIPIVDPLWGIGFFLLVNAFCRMSRRGMLRMGWMTRGLASIGLVSYSIYLLHEPALVVAKNLALRVGIDSVAAVIGVRLVAGIAIGYVFYWFVERHFLNSSRSAVLGTSARVLPAIADAVVDRERVELDP